RDGKRLLAALTDSTVGPVVVTRLTTAKNPQPADAFGKQIALVEKGGADQSGATGDASGLTQAQAAALGELERLMSAARRSATLAFLSGDPRLHSEFQVGVHDPHNLASELERAKKIFAAVTKYAAS